MNKWIYPKINMDFWGTQRNPNSHRFLLKRGRPSSLGPLSTFLLNDCYKAKLMLPGISIDSNYKKPRWFWYILIYNWPGQTGAPVMLVWSCLCSTWLILSSICRRNLMGHGFGDASGLRRSYLGRWVRIWMLMSEHFVFFSDFSPSLVVFLVPTVPGKHTQKILSDCLT
jgi:hypothetical protein